MMPDEWIPYLLNRMGIPKDSLLEALIILSLYPLLVILILQFYI
jgi:hypothetical protein